MFDMRRQTHNDAGYQLRITYNKDMNTYYVSGFIIRMNERNIMTYERDGAPVVYKTMQEAIDSIVNYGEKK